MIVANLIWAAPDWVHLTSVGLGLLALVILVVAYLRAPSSPAVRGIAAVLKGLAYAALLLCLLEPCWSGMRPQPGTNLFVVLADNSQSLQMHDAGEKTNRGERLQQLLTDETDWRKWLGQDFDVRRYVFDTRLHGVADFTKLTFDGGGSALANSLQTLAARFRGRPLAGVLVLTDGIATDLDEESFEFKELPPIFPVLIGQNVPAKDIRIDRVSVTQTNFETAPVTVLGEMVAHGFDRESVVIQLLDESGNELQQQIAKEVETGKPIVTRFQLQPERLGVAFYRFRAFPESERRLYEPGADPTKSQEATLANNSRLVLVDRGGGPYRVLYVSGRPNWEFKFLRRAIEDDEEVNLVGLVRIAKREPKFDFRSRRGESTNPLYRGFGNKDDETAEQYDQPVLLRLGTMDPEELQDGFPKSADQLYRYDAIILDDLEAGYFTQDQMLLLQKFASRRGGGFLMLGGLESFVKGEFRRTPIGELLPVYLDRLPDPQAPNSRYRLTLTQEGWLQPWVRVRANEEDEQRRLKSMPGFETVNRVHGVKPGATVLATVEEEDGTPRPALVTQRFGKGRVSALLIGDLWRWAMERTDADAKSDLEKAWRQTLRWLVADVPRRIELEASRVPNDPNQSIRLTARVRDEVFEPQDNASVHIRVIAPDASQLELTGDPSDSAAGVYETTYVPRSPGAYRATVTVAAPDGSEIGSRETGWTAEPQTAEFRTLQPNRNLLQRIAAQTGGEMVPANDIDDFVSSLQHRDVPFTEHWVFPLWHHWLVLSFAMLFLTAEWGLRRWKGLP